MIFKLKSLQNNAAQRVMFPTVDTNLRYKEQS